jgi:hypothetical protein
VDSIGLVVRMWIQCSVGKSKNPGSSASSAGIFLTALGKHVVDLREVAVHEGGVVGLPLLREPGDRGGRETGRAAEERLQGGHEVAGGPFARARWDSGHGPCSWSPGSHSFTGFS